MREEENPKIIPDSGSRTTEGGDSAKHSQYMTHHIAHSLSLNQFAVAYHVRGHSRITLQSFLNEKMRCISMSSSRMVGGGLHQPNAPQTRLKFGVHSRPAKNNKSLHKYPVLPVIPFEPTPRHLQDRRALEVLQQRQQFQGSMLLYYKIPLMLVEGRGQYLFDDQGHRYLDMFGCDGTIPVGHNHPLVTEAISKQSTKLTHLSHHFLSEESSEFTEVVS